MFALPRLLRPPLLLGAILTLLLSACITAYSSPYQTGPAGIGVNRDGVPVIMAAACEDGALFNRVAIEIGDEPVGEWTLDGPAVRGPAEIRIQGDTPGWRTNIVPRWPLGKGAVVVYVIWDREDGEYPWVMATSFPDLSGPLPDNGFLIENRDSDSDVSPVKVVPTFTCENTLVYYTRTNE